MIRNTWISLLAASLVVVYCSRSASADAMTDVLAAHKSTIQMIRTIYFRYEATYEQLAQVGPGSQPSGKTTGEYWRTRDAQRHTYTERGHTRSVYTTSDKVIAVGDAQDSKSGRMAPTAFIASNAGPISGDSSPWRDALLAMDSRRGTGTQLLEDHIREFLSPASYAVVDDYGVITCRGGAVVFQLDPKKNYLIRSKVSQLEGVKSPTTPPRTQRTHEVVREFQEVLTGIYFPKLVVIEKRLGDELVSRKTVVFTSIKINESIPVTVFNPVFKDGTQVTDQINSTTYTVKAGRSVGDEKPIVKIAVGPRSSEELRDQATPTAEEGRRPGWWLTPVGVCLVVVGVSVAVWRRGRRRLS